MAILSWPKNFFFVPPPSSFLSFAPIKLNFLNSPPLLFPHLRESIEKINDDDKKGLTIIFLFLSWNYIIIIINATGIEQAHFQKKTPSQVCVCVYLRHTHTHTKLRESPHIERLGSLKIMSSLVFVSCLIKMVAVWKPHFHLKNTRKQ